jgi:Fe-Mn family superoxide dismutase
MEKKAMEPGLLLALDLHEHARHRDRGAEAATEWAGLHARYQALVDEASEPWGVEPADVAGSLMLDVRRLPAHEQARTQLPGASWRDPTRVGLWAADVPRDRPVTVYCVHGHEVSRATALQLRAVGVDARFLRGGIDGWCRAGMPVEARGAQR